MKVIKIVVDEIPNNCLECNLHLCTLPLNKTNEWVLKPYSVKRHKECKLVIETKPATKEEIQKNYCHQCTGKDKDCGMCSYF